MKLTQKFLARFALKCHIFQQWKLTIFKLELDLHKESLFELKGLFLQFK